MLALKSMHLLSLCQYIPGGFCVDIIERISELKANSRNIPATILDRGADTKKKENGTGVRWWKTQLKYFYVI